MLQFESLPIFSISSNPKQNQHNHKTQNRKTSNHGIKYDVTQNRTHHKAPVSKPRSTRYNHRLCYLVTIIIYHTHTPSHTHTHTHPHTHTHTHTHTHIHLYTHITMTFLYECRCVCVCVCDIMIVTK